MASTQHVTSQNKERARGYLEAIEGHADGRIEGLADFVADGVVNHRPVSTDRAAAPTERGIEAFRRHAESVPSAFPDVRFDIRDVIAEDDRVMVRFDLSGTHAGPLMGVEPTGKRVAMSAIVVYRFEDGKIVERWSEADSLGLLQQLGVSELPSVDAE